MERPMNLDMLPRIMAAIVLIGLVDFLIRIFNALVLKRIRLRSKLAKQGIKGPPASFWLGNSREVLMGKPKNITNPSQEDGQQGNSTILHNYATSLFPCFEQWTKEYGTTFMFSLGKTQCLLMKSLDAVKEMSMCTSLDFGKASDQQKTLSPLLGQGILTSNGSIWHRQRKLLAPEFTMDKIKGMTNLIVECATNVVNSWTALIEEEGGIADVKVAKYSSRFSGDTISKACFGSSYAKGEEIFAKIRGLEDNLTKRVRFYGMPIMRYLPTKTNREIRRLEKEIRELILKAVKERREAGAQNDLLQMIIKGAEDSDLSKEEMDNFIVDNCKTIYLGGYESTSVATEWALMLLASNPEWQDKARAEVQEICGAQPPDVDMVRKMKTLTMVINETLRLYPSNPILTREALQDLKFGNVHVPKGVVTWTSVATMQQDPEIWGPDAHVFNPARFENGVRGACKYAFAYQPFGIGPRMCLGQHLAMTELKILLALLLSNFSISLSPNYKHAPIRKLIIRPQDGVTLTIRKL